MRADASRIQTVADLLLVTNCRITTTQGNTMDPGLRRGDGFVWLGSNFCVYCATMSKSNFLDPIPAYAGMTRTAYLFLFYEHCSGLCYLLFFKSSYRPGPRKIVRFCGWYQVGIHCPAGTDNTITPPTAWTPLRQRRGFFTP